jgi:hypothetical protein
MRRSPCAANPRGNREELVVGLQVRAIDQECGPGRDLAIVERRRFEIADPLAD